MFLKKFIIIIQASDNIISFCCNLANNMSIFLKIYTILHKIELVSLSFNQVKNIFPFSKIFLFNFNSDLVIYFNKFIMLSYSLLTTLKTL